MVFTYCYFLYYKLYYAITFDASVSLSFKFTMVIILPCIMTKQQPKSKSYRTRSFSLFDSINRC